LEKAFLLLTEAGTFLWPKASALHQWLWGIGCQTGEQQTPGGTARASRPEQEIAVEGRGEVARPLAPITEMGYTGKEEHLADQEKRQAG
jgi:hypothetical protein